MPARVASAGLRSDAPPLDPDRSRVGWLHAGDRLDQRGLARAVVSDQCDDLTGVDVEIDVHERGDRAEALADAACDQQRHLGVGVRPARHDRRRRSTMVPPPG